MTGGENDALAELEAELAADGAELDLEAELGEGASEAAQDGDAADAAPAGPSGAALADRLTIAGDDELAALPPRMLESAAAGLGEHRGPDADHTAAVADALGVTAHFVQAVAAAHEAAEDGSVPEPMTPHPAAAEVFDDSGELRAEVSQFLRSGGPLAEGLRSTFGRDTDQRVAGALRFGLAVDPGTLYRAFESAGWQDQLAAIKWLDQKARNVRKRS